MAILRRAGFDDVREGALITCEVSAGAKGPLVTNVLNIDASTAAEPRADGFDNVIHVAAPHLRATGDGVILNVTSVAGVRPLGSSIPYAVSKAALNHLTVLLANVLGPEIRVNAIAPGLIDTPWTEGWDAVRAAVQERGRWGGAGHRRTSPTRASACSLLATLTGQVLVLDEGLALNSAAIQTDPASHRA